ncbi:unnamed protein product [Cochlearia groenlandica]
MVSVTSSMAAKFAFFPPNPPSYGVDDEGGKLRLIGLESVKENVEVLQLKTKRATIPSSTVSSVHGVVSDQPSPTRFSPPNFLFSPSPPNHDLRIRLQILQPPLNLRMFHGDDLESSAAESPPHHHHRHITQSIANITPYIHVYDPIENQWFRFNLDFFHFRSPLPVASSCGLIYLWGDSLDSSE